MFNKLFAQKGVKMKLMPLLTLAFAGSLVAQSYFIKGPESPKPYEAMAIKELAEYLAKHYSKQYFTTVHHKNLPNKVE